MKTGEMKKLIGWLCVVSAIGVVLLSQILMALCLFGIGLSLLPVTAKLTNKWLSFQLRPWHRGAAVVIFVLLLGVAMQPLLEEVPDTSQNPVPQQAGLPSEPQARIRAILGQEIDNPSVSFFDKQFNVDAAAKPPFEVIVNATASGCFDAKEKLLEAMRSLYADSVASSQVSRVVVNLTPYVSASLGANDARAVSKDTWNATGPSNFLKILEQSGSGDIDGIAVENLTWGQRLTGCQ